jgi:hypothetical protein
MIWNHRNLNARNVDWRPNGICVLGFCEHGWRRHNRIQRRDHRRRARRGPDRKKRIVDKARALIPRVYELRVDLRVRVPEAAAVEAEAVRCHRICGAPALNVAVAEELKRRGRAS